MCRFFAYRGAPIMLKSLLIDPSHSILKQSYDARERKEPLNGDGFGIGWYDERIDDQPAVFRDISPAWSNRNLIEISSKLMSASVFAHVRAATDGLGVNEWNCHPFKFGKLLWMHNGKVHAFDKIKREILSHLRDEYYHNIQGNTDSEYAFALFLTILDPLKNPDFTGEEMVEAMNQTIHELIRLNNEHEGNSALNFACTDGHIYVFSRYTTNIESEPPTLYYAHGGIVVPNGEHIEMRKSRRKRFYMVASEAIDGEGELWTEVPKNHILLIEDDQHTITPIEN